MKRRLYMKKFWSAFLVALMAMSSLVGCGGQSSATADSSTTPSTENSATPSDSWAPSGSIDFVCPYSAGGGSDICTRTIATVMSKYTDANAVVQNLGGGGGLVGTSYVVGKKGDDMTLCSYAPGQVSNAIANNPDCGWDKVTQLAVLALEEQTLTVQSGKFKDLKELIEYSKSHPGEVTIAGTTYGNEDHMCVELLNQTADANLTYVTYDSAGDILTAILGGHITGGICNPSENSSYVLNGDVDVLCSFSANDIHYIEGFEEVPTAKSLGYDIDFVMFRGVVGAPGMSADAKAYWVDMLKKVSEDPDWVDGFVEARGLTPYFLSGDELMDFMQNQHDMYEKLMKDVGLL